MSSNSTTTTPQGATSSQIVRQETPQIRSISDAAANLQLSRLLPITKDLVEPDATLPVLSPQEIQQANELLTTFYESGNNLPAQFLQQDPHFQYQTCTNAMRLCIDGMNRIMGPATSLFTQVIEHNIHLHGGQTVTSTRNIEAKELEWVNQFANGSILKADYHKLLKSSGQTQRARNIAMLKGRFGNQLQGLLQYGFQRSHFVMESHCPVDGDDATFWRAAGGETHIKNMKAVLLGTPVEHLPEIYDRLMTKHAARSQKNPSKVAKRTGNQLTNEDWKLCAAEIKKLNTPPIPSLPSLDDGPVTPPPQATSSVAPGPVIAPIQRPIPSKIREVRSTSSPLQSSPTSQAPEPSSPNAPEKQLPSESESDGSPIRKSRRIANSQSKTFTYPRQSASKGHKRGPTKTSIEQEKPPAKRPFTKSASIIDSDDDESDSSNEPRSESEPVEGYNGESSNPVAPKPLSKPDLPPASPEEASEETTKLFKGLAPVPDFAPPSASKGKGRASAVHLSAAPSSASKELARQVEKTHKPHKFDVVIPVRQVPATAPQSTHPTSSASSSSDDFVPATAAPGRSEQATPRSSKLVPTSPSPFRPRLPSWTPDQSPTRLPSQSPEQPPNLSPSPFVPEPPSPVHKSTEMPEQMFTLEKCGCTKLIIEFVDSVPTHRTEFFWHKVRVQLDLGLDWTVIKGNTDNTTFICCDEFLGQSLAKIKARNPDWFTKAVLESTNLFNYPTRSQNLLGGEPFSIRSNFASWFAKVFPEDSEARPNIAQFETDGYVSLPKSTFGWLQQLKHKIRWEFELYRSLSPKPKALLKNMFHSLIQQALANDPGLYALNVWFRSDRVEGGYQLAHIPHPAWYQSPISEGPLHTQAHMSPIAFKNGIESCGNHRVLMAVAFLDDTASTLSIHTGSPSEASACLQSQNPGVPTLEPDDRLPNCISRPGGLTILSLPAAHRSKVSGLPKAPALNEFEGYAISPLCMWGIEKNPARYMVAFPQFVKVSSITYGNKKTRTPTLELGHLRAGEVQSAFLTKTNLPYDTLGRPNKGCDEIFDFQLALEPPTQLALAVNSCNTQMWKTAAVQSELKELFDPLLAKDFIDCARQKILLDLSQKYIQLEKLVGQRYGSPEPRDWSCHYAFKARPEVAWLELDSDYHSGLDETDL
ncbi:hypothetical protein ABW21_db0207886 [Orbilia brochopaga]|nr:hypothetical protein ABW21_db0207886 [Drechslerella brochopaga]